MEPPEYLEGFQTLFISFSFGFPLILHSLMEHALLAFPGHRVSPVLYHPYVDQPEPPSLAVTRQQDHGVKLFTVPKLA